MPSSNTQLKIGEIYWYQFSFDKPSILPYRCVAVGDEGMCEVEGCLPRYCGAVFEILENFEDRVPDMYRSISFGSISGARLSMLRYDDLPLFGEIKLRQWTDPDETSLASSFSHNCETIAIQRQSEFDDVVSHQDGPPLDFALIGFSPTKRELQRLFAIRRIEWLSIYKPASLEEFARCQLPQSLVGFLADVEDVDQRIIRRLTRCSNLQALSITGDWRTEVDVITNSTWPRLERLHLTGACLCPEFSITPVARSLRSLRLCESSFHQKFIASLGESMLQALSLSFTATSDDDVDLICNCKSLRSLSLTGCHITGKTLECLERLPNLRHVALGLNRIDVNELRAFRNACPDCIVTV